MQFFEWSATLKQKNAVTFRGRTGSVFFSTHTAGRSEDLLYDINTLIVTFVPFSGAEPFACFLRVTQKILPGQTRTGVTSENRPEQIATAQLEGEPGQLKTCNVTRLKG
ncbi:hypothetical protein [Deinococcus arcticus]|uniref:Uncharacterized protein n=1 Tax=Deinococcus arcticus TaxID=2136176 RepID=A0A2T3W8J7_9DEIO|nr:hypothetical protein [Deinococcus arcticus]PTA68212.1 hypothetical protein C8263_09135 [Deinococcus arcticus]